MNLRADECQINREDIVNVVTDVGIDDDLGQEADCAPKRLKLDWPQHENIERGKQDQLLRIR